jgi:hypothetical protein
MIGREPILEGYTIVGEDGKRYRFTQKEMGEMVRSCQISVTESDCNHIKQGATWRLRNRSLCQACWYREKHEGEGHEITEEQGLVTCKCTLPKYEES